MQRAGLAVASQALAIAPHARTIWIACGPGNNGGDGFEAAAQLSRRGKRVIVTQLAPDKEPPRDAAYSLKHALGAGVIVSEEPPSRFELCIDALFGIGALRPWSDRCAQWIAAMNASASPTLAVDLPSGLDADTGRCAPLHVRAQHTLTLLTLKPGLFTADGRTASGNIWFNDLGVQQPANACANLSAFEAFTPRAHNTHKGSYGDVAILGGAESMEGAAILAARGALHAGAGRVYVALLHANAISHDPAQPELMFRDINGLNLAELTVVAGCGGGAEIGGCLSDVLRHASKLVLDADGINAIASQPPLQALIKNRAPNSTVLTPHPLEAGRLLGVSSSHVQSDRLGAAQSLAEQFSCVVTLKGSGTVIAAPGMVPCINPTGNGRLASAGTGDVLAGMIGAHLAQGQPAFKASCLSVFHHGAIADRWPTTDSFTAQSLFNRAS